MSAVTKSQLNRCPPIHKHIGLTPYVRMGPPLAVVNRGPCPPPLALNRA